MIPILFELVCRNISLEINESLNTIFQLCSYLSGVYYFKIEFYFSETII